MISLNNHYQLHQLDAQDAQRKAQQHRLAQAARQITPSLMQRTLSALAALRPTRTTDRPAATAPQVRIRRA